MTIAYQYDKIGLPKGNTTQKGEEMKVTKKAINADLPRRDYLTKRYLPHGWGNYDGRDYIQYFGSAFCLVRADGEVRIYVYGNSDAVDYCVAHPQEGAQCFDISHIVLDWIEGTYGCDRRTVVDRIWNQVFRSDYDGQY